MVVAPLGGAIMALAGALVTGRTRWQTITLLQVVGGAAMVVAIGFVVSVLAPNILALTPQLEARTRPGIWDIGVALAAGAAGAYVAARRTGNDALPGVAIAVSLVPPLATVGICLELGRYPEALGAFLLFATNFAAILVVASIVFMLFGYAPSPTELRERHRLRNGFILAVLLLVLAAAPLVAHGISQVTATLRSLAGAPVVREWIGDRQLSVTSWEIDGDVVRLELEGPDAPAPASTLAGALATTFGQPVSVEIRYTPVTVDRADAAP